MRTLIVSDNPTLLEALQRLVSGIPTVASSRGFDGTIAMLAAAHERDDTDVIVLDAGADPLRALDGLETLLRRSPTTRVLLVGGADSPEVLRRAIRLGVREVVHAPVSAEELVESLRRIAAEAREASGAQGQVLSFVSCKGGSGATFLATNLGYALAAVEGKRVLLIDLNLQYGDAALFVSDRWPKITVADAVRGIAHVDAAFLGAAVVPVLPNYGVLAASEDPTQAADVQPSQVEALIRFARGQFDYVLLDLGRALDPVTVRALDLSDRVFPVLQLMLPYARDGRRMLDVFRTLGYATDKVRPIVNRVEKASPLTIDDMERALGAKVFATVPNHFASVSESVNQGRPIVTLARTSPVARGLSQLARQVVGQPDAGAERWLGRLFSRG